MLQLGPHPPEPRSDVYGRFPLERLFTLDCIAKHHRLHALEDFARHETALRAVDMPVAHARLAGDVVLERRDEVQAEWNVPDHGSRTSFFTSATMRLARRVIVGLAGTGPATMSSGAAPAQAASRCRGFSFSNASIAPTAGDYRPKMYVYPVLGSKKKPSEDGL